MSWMNGEWERKMNWIDDKMEEPMDYEEVSESCTLPFEKIAQETSLSWLIVFDSSDIFNPKKAWMPKSMCALDEDNNEIIVPEWLAIEKDLV